MNVHCYSKSIKNQKGFTLMELLVTVILVGVLASFSIYHYNNTIEEGRLNAAKGKLAALGGATARYMIEHSALNCSNGSKDVEASYATCGNNSGDERIYDVFACGYAEKSLAHEENFKFIFGCPSTIGECGTFTGYTVVMKPLNNNKPDVFPDCAYFDMDMDKIVEVRAN